MNRGLPGIGAAKNQSYGNLLRFLRVIQLVSLPPGPNISFSGGFPPPGVLAGALFSIGPVVRVGRNSAALLIAVRAGRFIITTEITSHTHLPSTELKSRFALGRREGGPQGIGDCGVVHGPILFPPIFRYKVVDQTVRVGVDCGSLRLAARAKYLRTGKCRIFPAQTLSPECVACRQRIARFGAHFGGSA